MIGIFLAGLACGCLLMLLLDTLIQTLIVRRNKIELIEPEHLKD